MFTIHPSKTTQLYSLLALSISLALSGCNNYKTTSPTVTSTTLKTGSVLLEKSLGQVAFAGGNTLSLDVGFGSGAYHASGDAKDIFYTTTDRGPNIKCKDSEDVIGVKDFCQDNGQPDYDGKIFPIADFTPTSLPSLTTSTMPSRCFRLSASSKIPFPLSPLSDKVKFSVIVQS